MFLLLKVPFDCCLPGLDITAFDALPSVLGVPFINVVAMIASRCSSPTPGAELWQNCVAELVGNVQLVMIDAFG